MNITKLQRPTYFALPGFGQVGSLSDEIDRLFESPFSARARNAWLPALDVVENKESFVIQAELPGLKREDIEVSFHEGTLTISGERKSETASDDTSVHRVERYAGRFERSIELPPYVAVDKAKAAYTDGVLTVTLPKSEQAKPRKIDVALN